MNEENTELARLQADLLDCFVRDESADVLARLREVETGISYRAWIASFDPHMAQLAATLVQKWGQRSDR